jgi:hypothetical protein
MGSMLGRLFRVGEWLIGLRQQLNGSYSAQPKTLCDFLGIGVREKGWGLSIGKKAYTPPFFSDP